MSQEHVGAKMISIRLRASQEPSDSDMNVILRLLDMEKEITTSLRKVAAKQEEILLRAISAAETFREAFEILQKFKII